MADIKHNGTTFYLSDEIQAKYPELIKLILNTESMDDDERQYWFDIMPSMNEDQINRLFEILDTERQKLLELETKYQEEIKQLNEKQLIEWQEYQAKKNREKIMTEESKEKKVDAEDILSELDFL